MPTLERNLFGVRELRRSVAVFRDLLHAHQARIDQLNVYPIADRDTGTNMARTLDAVVAALDDTPADLAMTCDAVAQGSLMGARGNSGGCHKKFVYRDRLVGVVGHTGSPAPYMMHGVSPNVVKCRMSAP